MTDTFTRPPPMRSTKYFCGAMLTKTFQGCARAGDAAIKKRREIKEIKRRNAIRALILAGFKPFIMLILHLNFQLA
ncbi:hypothetical protein [Desulfonatronum parangueonense]